ncbi:putative phage protein [Xenorhabdus poinarii G6]|uniref:Putative phage protein n=1 Tax=Xenorhabdus poinarii G6 TaxID=1354304 RepID=A0A068QYH3_9GAMM|nr:BRO family protein [Xenorhabdus poinarii]CDG20008.1 putative phage protein [Xenorhabdus poinarii G6]
MSAQLVFQDTVFNPVHHTNKIWLTAVELAKALGYKKSDAVNQIYERNSDEFTAAMTETLKLSVSDKSKGCSDNLQKTVRIFSLRGAHLVAMLSKTKIAKEFRKWVLDILDREVENSSEVTKPKSPGFRYLIKMEVYDRHLNKTETFTGRTETPRGIVTGIARQYRYHIESMIELPIGIL